MSKNINFLVSYFPITLHFLAKNLIYKTFKIFNIKSIDIYKSKFYNKCIKKCLRRFM